MKKIILIGGAPVSGKSYAARKIAEHLKLPWISTDTIREQMREIVRKEDFPKLFLYEDESPEGAVEYLSNTPVEKILDDINEEGEDVWEGVKGLIKTDYTWDSFIVEGVAILPQRVKDLSIKNKEIKAVFILNENVESIRKRIFTRGLWNDADKYPDEVKEKEVEWVIEFNKYLFEEAKKYRFPVVKVDDNEDYITKITELVG